MSWYKEIVNNAGGRISEVGEGIRDFASKGAKAIRGFIEPGAARLEKAGLLKGGKRREAKPLPKTNVNFSNRNSKTVVDDWRVRISMSNEVASLFYANPADNNIMAPLAVTQGVIFPYTPQVQVTYQANYTPQRLTHTNYQTYFYESSEVQAISITADFTVQNQEEARYVLACIYFFRAATKMFYGQSENRSTNNVGQPPPLVFLNGYGEQYFPNVPCIVTQFSHTMPNDVDYIETDYRFAQENTSAYKPERTTRIPTISQITVSLQPVYSKSVAATFDLQKFARGELLKDKGSFI